MLGLRLSSAAIIVAAGVTVLALSTPPSFAASAHQRVRPTVQQEGIYQPSARARYEAAFPNTIDRSTQCIGGYRYMRHIYDANRTAAQDEVPLPCR